MQLPLQISFRGIERSPEIEAIIEDKADRLESFASRITSCRVVVELVGKHHESGNLYDVRVDVTVPGDEIVATHQPGKHEAFKDMGVAIRDAFDSVGRQLEDYVRRQRGDVKTHTHMAHGHVAKIMASGDFGFLETGEGREIYFHRNSVLNDAFDRLKVGSEVSFAEEEGEKGPQASTVKLVGRHGHA